jgi:antitoxin (DNA-binding transcriptional repressor) of toxin-antitoxin stability system
MATIPKTIPAGQFNARCLALLDEVARSGQSLVVTKRGRAVARVGPVTAAKRAGLAGSVLSDDGLLAPIDAEWEAAK